MNAQSINSNLKASNGVRIELHKDDTGEYVFTVRGQEVINGSTYLLSRIKADESTMEKLQPLIDEILSCQEKQQLPY